MQKKKSSLMSMKFYVVILFAALTSGCMSVDVNIRLSKGSSEQYSSSSELMWFDILYTCFPVLVLNYLIVPVLSAFHHLFGHNSQIAKDML